MWGKRRVREIRKRHELSADSVPNDLDEARKMRAQSQDDLEQAEAQEPFITRLTEGLRARGPQNHYIELLFQKVSENT